MTNMSVRDIMNARRHVVVAPDTSVREAAALMAARQLGAVAVVAGKSLVGILTERDVLNRVSARRRDPARINVEHAMTANPQTIAPEESALEACERMQFGGFRHLPVIEGDELIGMLSVGDLPFDCPIEGFGAYSARFFDGMVRRRSRQEGDRLAAA